MSSEKNQFVFTSQQSLQRYRQGVQKQQHIMQSETQSQQPILLLQDPTQKLNKSRTFNEASSQWNQQQQEDQSKHLIMLNQGLQRQRSFLPSGIQNPLKAIQINSEIRQRRSANLFKSPFRLNQKLQGIQDAKRQMESLSQPVISTSPQQISSGLDGEGCPTAIKQSNTKRRRLSEHDQYIEYLKIHSQSIEEQPHPQEDLSRSINSTNSLIERQETPRFGQEEQNNMIMEVIQRDFMLKINLGDSIREEEPIEPKIEGVEPVYQPPAGFDDWCQPNEVNMSIPESLECSSDQQSPTHEEFIEGQIQELRKSQLNQQNACNIQSENYQYFCKEEHVITPDLISNLTKQYFSRMLDVQDE